MKRNLIRALGGSVFLEFLVNAPYTFAVGASPSLTLPNPLGCGSFGCVTSDIINLIYTIAIPLCAIMVLVGGFQIMTSAGNPEKLSTGRKTILWAAGGFVVILFAKGVTGFVQSFFHP